MVAQLKGVVDLIRTGISDLRNFQSAKAREDAVLGVLRVYFLLKDCVDDGETLVNEAQPNPVEKISKMAPELALSTIEKWDATIRKQGIRLYQLQGALLGQRSHRSNQSDLARANNRSHWLQDGSHHHIAWHWCRPLLQEYVSSGEYA